MRLLWMIIGLIALGLGMIGAVLPLLPTTPFLLLAAFAFARSSPRLAAWLDRHPQFGPMITNWREHGAISRRAKTGAMILLLMTPAVSVALRLSWTIIAVQIVILSFVATFILTRPDAP
ncbi:MAG: YbaN family protein [Pseudomonadota bacterium]